MNDIFAAARPGQWLTIDRAEYRGLNLRVQKVEEIERIVGVDRHPMKDLVLEKSRDQFLKVRTFLTDETSNVVVLTLREEFGFEQGFADLLQDPSGLFTIHSALPDGTTEEQTFARHGEVIQGYVCESTVHEPKGVRGSRRFDLHIFSRDAEDEGGTVRAEFVMIEQNTLTGMFSIWRGFSVTPFAVTLI